MNLNLDANYQPVFYDHGMPVVTGLARALADIASAPAELQRQRTRHDVALSEIEGVRQRRIRDALGTYLDTGTADPTYAKDLEPYAGEAQRRAGIRAADQQDRAGRQQADRLERIRRGDEAPMSPVPLEMEAATEGKRVRDANAKLLEQRAQALDLAGLGRLMGAGGKGAAAKINAGTGWHNGGDGKFFRTDADGNLITYDADSKKTTKSAPDGRVLSDGEPRPGENGEVAFPTPDSPSAGFFTMHRSDAPGINTLGDLTGFRWSGGTPAAAVGDALGAPSAPAPAQPAGEPPLPPAPVPANAAAVKGYVRPASENGPRQPGAISVDTAKGYQSSIQDVQQIAGRLAAVDPQRAELFRTVMDKAHRDWLAASQAGDQAGMTAINQKIIAAKNAALAKLGK